MSWSHWTDAPRFTKGHNDRSFPLRHSEMQEMPVVEAFGCFEVCLQNRRAGVNEAMRVRVLPSGINYVIVRLSCVHQLHIVFNYHILLATPFPSLCPAGILSSAGHFTSMILILIYLIFLSLRYPQQFCRGSFSFKCSIIEKKWIIQKQVWLQFIYFVFLLASLFDQVKI